MVASKTPQLGQVTDKGQTELPRWAERRTTTRPPPHVVIVSLVIPSKNEARNLATVPDSVSEVILVDSLSSDVTETITGFEIETEFTARAVLVGQRA